MGWRLPAGQDDRLWRPLFLSFITQVFQLTELGLILRKSPWRKIRQCRLEKAPADGPVKG